jgi:putative Ca2+/H+ antiporter (TMEM165/GDT1 family)
LFFGFALWLLVPDKLDDDDGAAKHNSSSAFLTTLVLFFLAEIGDKTQLATLVLGAKFQSSLNVTIGTTLGMLVADGLAVMFGERLTQIVPMKAIRFFSAFLFALFGAGILLKWHL